MNEIKILANILIGLVDPGPEGVVIVMVSKYKLYPTRCVYQSTTLLCAYPVIQENNKKNDKFPSTGSMSCQITRMRSRHIQTASRQLL